MTGETPEQELERLKQEKQITTQLFLSFLELRANVQANSEVLLALLSQDDANHSVAIARLTKGVPAEVWYAKRRHELLLHNLARFEGVDPKATADFLKQVLPDEDS